MIARFQLAIKFILVAVIYGGVSGATFGSLFLWMTWDFFPTTVGFFLGVVSGLITGSFASIMKTPISWFLGGMLGGFFSSGLLCTLIVRYLGGSITVSSMFLFYAWPIIVGGLIGALIYKDLLKAVPQLPLIGWLKSYM